ncbi:hypothetical protein [Saccharothrix sp.]|uniref:hypothetical protein n=1 Tax=Saccharothrix sp. TaxID=1873460 RepID=UPI0028115D1C|nr:hypothetical protein [Saccharothrix sp.]
MDFLASLLEARVHGASGDEVSCLRALERAERLSPDLRTLPSRQGLMLLDAGRAACFRDLAVRRDATGRDAAGLAARAVECAPEALRRTPVNSRSSRALFSVRLADAYACAAEPESAVAAAQATVAAAQATVAAAQATVGAPWGGDLVRRKLVGLKQRFVAGWGGFERFGGSPPSSASPGRGTEGSGSRWACG